MSRAIKVAQPTMSSREIAELTGKEHRNVARDIRAMLGDLEEDALKFEHIYLDSMNREQIEYLLDRELTETLLTGYSAILRRKVIHRWHELEDAAAQARILRETEYLPSYRPLHDGLKGLGRDSAHQRWLHMNMNRLTNRAAGIPAGGRAAAPVGSLARLIVAQIQAAEAVKGAADDEDAYRRAKAAVAPLLALGGAIHG